MFFICVVSDGTLRSLIDGFWYNDAYRIAALVALAGIPLASMGLCAICDLVDGLLRGLCEKGPDKRIVLLLPWDWLYAALIFQGELLAMSVWLVYAFEDGGECSVG